VDVIWEDMTALIAFVLNIPTRFEFEKRFYEAREARPLRPEELSSFMSDAWRSSYGEAISEPDPLFWASKLHFFISGISFYNFPYLFGYLFSLGVYASRAEFGDGFFDRYRALLRDTGRMTAEELARKHLDADLTAPDFWHNTLEALAPRVDMFAEVMAEAGFPEPE
jgi:oligoendopeptidase F